MGDNISHSERMTVDHHISRFIVKLAMMDVSIKHGFNQATNKDQNCPGCKFLTPICESKLRLTFPLLPRPFP